MQPALSRLGHVFLAADQQLHLIGHLVQPAKNLAVSIHESENCVGDTRILAEFLDQPLQLPEVVPRHSREEMVHCLEL